MRLCTDSLYLLRDNSSERSAEGRKRENRGLKVGNARRQAVQAQRDATSGERAQRLNGCAGGSVQGRDELCESGQLGRGKGGGD